MVRGAGVALATVILLAFAGPAAAATPQTIYRDLADNGRLDRHYSKRDINRALHMPSLLRYELEDSSRGAQSTRTPRVPSTPSPEKARSIPFTGLDLALFGGVGGPLLVLGAGLGRLLRVGERELR
jgi:hypothetical protein